MRSFRSITRNRRVCWSVAGQGKPRVTPTTLDLAPGEVWTVQVSGPTPPELAKYGVTVLVRTVGPPRPALLRTSCRPHQTPAVPG
jgi:hypothetical protein